ncbi:unnamed protein product [Heligmosomoides polygyrus]|uniref:Uncharacterized protein n=1 Tax=Heligmosomoides polygyrus TaxID=6339 RepID=A0A3P8FBB9_HELPZ|nr:unnamed protein product [Heligmosomoides polygyrus]
MTILIVNAKELYNILGLAMTDLGESIKKSLTIARLRFHVDIIVMKIMETNKTTPTPAVKSACRPRTTATPSPAVSREANHAEDSTKKPYKASGTLLKELLSQASKTQGAAESS